MYADFPVATYMDARYKRFYERQVPYDDGCGPGAHKVVGPSAALRAHRQARSCSDAVRDAAVSAGGCRSPSAGARGETGSDEALGEQSRSLIVPEPLPLAAAAERLRKKPGRPRKDIDAVPQLLAPTPQVRRLLDLKS